MKRLIFVLLCLSLLLPMGVLAVDESRSYEFELSVNGKQEAKAEPGDILTVTVYLRRTDKKTPADIYSIQDEIHYDSEQLELVEGSAIMDTGIVTTDIAITGTERAFLLAFGSFRGGEEWEADKLLGSFQLRVLGDTGTVTLTQENYLVSIEDGSDVFVSSAKNVSIRLPKDAPQPTETPTEQIEANTSGTQKTVLLIAILLIIALLIIVYEKQKHERRKPYRGVHVKH